jgi:hypothetical protein
MAALNFPDSPTSGQIFSGSVMNWKWNTVTWQPVYGGATTAGTNLDPTLYAELPSGMSSNDWTFVYDVANSELKKIKRNNWLSNNAVLTSGDPLTIQQTWNSSGTQFTALKVNVSSLNSATDSSLLDLQVGGQSQFKFYKSGSLDIQGAIVFAGTNSASATRTNLGGGAVGQDIFMASTKSGAQTAIGIVKITPANYAALVASSGTSVETIYIVQE